MLCAQTFPGRRITLRPHYVHPSEPAHNFLRSVFADGF